MVMATALAENDPRYRIWCLTVLFQLAQRYYNARWAHLSSSLNPFTHSVTAFLSLDAAQAKFDTLPADAQHLTILNFLALILSRSQLSDGKAIQDQEVAILASDFTVGENDVIVAMSEIAHTHPHEQGDGLVEEVDAASLPSSDAYTEQNTISRNTLAKLPNTGAEGPVIHDDKSQDSENRRTYLSACMTRTCCPDKRSLPYYPDYVNAVIDLVIRCARLKEDPAAQTVAVQRLDELVVHHQLPKIQLKTKQILKRYFSEDEKAPRSLLRLKFPDPMAFEFSPPPAWDDPLKQMASRGTVKAVPGTDRYVVDGCFFVTGIFNLLKRISNGINVPNSLLELHAMMKTVPKNFWNSETVMEFFVADAMARNMTVRKEADVARDSSDHGEESDDESDTYSAVRRDIDTGGVRDAVKVFMRQMESLTAATTATHFLVRRPVFRSAVEFKINIVQSQHSFLPLGDMDVDDMIAEMQSKNLLNEKTITRLRDIRQDDRSAENGRRDLSGSCYCEATLMTSLLARDSTVAAQLRSSKYLMIGVSKMCCPFCWELLAILRETHGSKLICPGFHNAFSPWIPPPGLSDDVLSNLEVALRRKLQIMLALASELDNEEMLPKLSDGIFRDWAGVTGNTDEYDET
ncbi:hypothetical protein EIP91_005773 [Steccherinum ochraceum]|uniref:Uncharacterized protein n=1 Tax=Steccherinum ochraceum TaxID=92696 RepID=A0A4R0R9K0_9APHY|nr:hypothetical protein EIP91_005773 [Steccherinum ochraceum]